MLDLLIKNGDVIDGTGAPVRRRCGIAVQNGKIVALGLEQAEAERVIDAAGLTVTPGFVDIHRHADAAVFRPDFGTAELRQGLTTIVNGNCGISLAPFGPAHKQEILAYARPILGDVPYTVETAAMDGYLEQVGGLELPLHVGMLAGGGVIRADTAGFAASRLLPQQFDQIHSRMESALAAGALGISLGLGYAPECFYTPPELVRALQPLANTGIPVTVHMRQEGDRLIECVQEMIHLSRALDTPVHISHLKAIGRKNWRRLIPQVLDLLRRAREDGVAVSCDVYPYTAGSTQLLHLLPPEFLQGGAEAALERLKDADYRRELRVRLQTGTDFENIVRLAGWENIVVSSLTRPEHRPCEGKTLAEAAALLDLEPLDCLCELLTDGAASMIDFIACEQDIAEILAAPFSCAISDSVYPTGGRVHPRLYGTFARILETYVYKQHDLSLEQAIHKMTAAPADVLDLREKGRIAVGADADLNLFDPAGVHETATYDTPDRCATGFAAVIVAGEVAVCRDTRTDACAGSVLLR